MGVARTKRRRAGCATDPRCFVVRLFCTVYEYVPWRDGTPSHLTPADGNLDDIITYYEISRSPSPVSVCLCGLAQRCTDTYSALGHLQESKVGDHPHSVPCPFSGPGADATDVVIESTECRLLLAQTWLASSSFVGAVVVVLQGFFFSML